MRRALVWEDFLSLSLSLLWRMRRALIATPCFSLTYTGGRAVQSLTLLGKATALKSMGGRSCVVLSSTLWVTSTVHIIKSLRYFLPLQVCLGLEKQKVGDGSFPLKNITCKWMHCFQVICANFDFTCDQTLRTWYISKTSFRRLSPLPIWKWGHLLTPPLRSVRVLEVILSMSHPLRHSSYYIPDSWGLPTSMSTSKPGIHSGQYVICKIIFLF